MEVPGKKRNSAGKAGDERERERESEERRENERDVFFARCVVRTEKKKPFVTPLPNWRALSHV